MIDINDLIGKPFSDDPGLAYGPDYYSCYGLLCEVYRRYGIMLPRTNIAVTACRSASAKEIAAHTKKNWQQIEAPCVPCGVLIRSGNPAFADHIGVYIGDGRLLHITINRNVVVDRLNIWEKKIIGYYIYVDHCNDRT